ncbi:MAG: winged helix-turn-helix domain-containing protein [Oscillospiraceae bacterium]|nr:winged helix-turn-helix domain-containing protein [Oscillospiraceae bacterium]
MNNDRYYLLTGAAGFLGTNICMQLLEAGCKVRALVLPNDKSVKFIPTDGFEFVKTVRSLNENIPILFMTARDDFASKQRGYRIGVDDYMIKPIDLDELFLRIGALLRRAKIASSRKIEVGRFSMDMDEHIALLDGEEISLTRREFNILYKLLSYPKKTFTRQQLMDEFWDADTDTAPRAVDVYMTKLRSKLSDCDDFEIKTVHGLGYKAVVK